MKVTIELSEEILLALARMNAKAAAVGWWESYDTDLPTIREIGTDAPITLYEYAFKDGMDYLLDLIKEQ